MCFHFELQSIENDGLEEASASFVYWQKTLFQPDIFLSCFKHTADPLVFYWNEMRNFSFQNNGFVSRKAISSRSL